MDTLANGGKGDDLLFVCKVRSDDVNCNPILEKLNLNTPSRRIKNTPSLHTRIVKLEYPVSKYLLLESGHFLYLSFFFFVTIVTTQHSLVLPYTVLVLHCI